MTQDDKESFIGFLLLLGKWRHGMTDQQISHAVAKHITRSGIMRLCHVELFQMIDRMENRVLKDSPTPRSIEKEKEVKTKIDTLRLVKDRVRIEFLL